MDSTNRQNSDNRRSDDMDRDDRRDTPADRGAHGDDHSDPEHHDEDHPDPEDRGDTAADRGPYGNDRADPDHHGDTAAERGPHGDDSANPGRHGDDYTDADSRGNDPTGSGRRDDARTDADSRSNDRTDPGRHGNDRTDPGWRDDDRTESKRLDDDGTDPERNRGGMSNWLSPLIAVLGVWMVVATVLLDVAGSHFWSGILVGALLIAVGGYTYSQQANDRVGNSAVALIAVAAGLWLIAAPYVLGGNAGLGESTYELWFYNHMAVGLLAVGLGAYSAARSRDHPEDTSQTEA